MISQDKFDRYTLDEICNLFYIAELLGEQCINAEASNKCFMHLLSYATTSLKQASDYELE